MAASAQALIERAERCLDTFDLPLALKFYERALTLEPDDVPTLDAAGELLMRLGNADRAVAMLQRSVALRAEGNFATHMNLGQLLGGAEALVHFETGLRLLRKREAPLRKRSAKGAAGAEAREELDVVEGHICAALCAIAEIYLSDLCDEPDAEAACERAVQAALEVGKGSGRAPLAEALQACANLRISQCRPADAASALLSVVQHIANAVDAGSLEALPPHEFRTSTAKLCLEVGEDEAALEVLEQLLLEVGRGAAAGGIEKMAGMCDTA
jgi:tetratricopeptide (TPR) repeat protein